jgi:hypothetical protein
MSAPFLLAISSGSGATLIWIAFVGLLILAIILYLPQKFSGPLTELERQAAHGGLRGRVFALVLAAPLATVSGFVLLLPPMVKLHVPSHARRAHPIEGSYPHLSSWSYLAFNESTSEWTLAVRCRVKAGGRGETALIEAILAAARSGFDVPKGCIPASLDTWELASVELSLVEIAARAYMLTEAIISAGPRLHDPDPWDVMAQTLEIRRVPTALTDRKEREQSDPRSVLRLTRARVGHGATRGLEVLALIRGDACTQPFSGKLIAPDGLVLDDSCRLLPSGACERTSDTERMLRMTVTCAKFPDAQTFMSHPGGILLSADYGETPVRMSDRLDPLGVAVRGTRAELFGWRGGEHDHAGR